MPEINKKPVVRTTTVTYRPDELAQVLVDHARGSTTNLGEGTVEVYPTFGGLHGARVTFMEYIDAKDNPSGQEQHRSDTTGAGPYLEDDPIYRAGLRDSGLESARWSEPVLPVQRGGEESSEQQDGVRHASDDNDRLFPLSRGPRV